MIITRSSNLIEIQTPAKVNLFLEVLGKRADGFHQIETVMCPISLFDRLTLEPTSAPKIEFELILPRETPKVTRGNIASSSDPAWQIPGDASNLVVRAATRVQAELGTTQGCRIRLEKNIPAAAGLGGGSSNAAAVVTACLLAWSRWDRELATRVCSEIGSDVPFFLGAPTHFGIALATGRGEACQVIAAQPAMSFVVTHPPVGCSTKSVYDAYVKMGEVRDYRTILASCEDGQFENIGAGLFNALQFPAESLTGWIGQQLRLLQHCGAKHTLMSGSGSSCFALLDGTMAASELCQRVRFEGLTAGLSRVYEARAWYGPSIESQS
jgi:4-diphosphocytidyl-2-C-methyl-D-erythritol kinase